MRTVLYYLLTVLLAITLGYFLMNMRPKSIPKVITVDTEYSFLMGDDERGSFVIYINEKHHDLTKISHYDRLYIYDNHDESKIELSLLTVALGHEEMYLSERFYRIIITFKLPFSNHDFSFKDAYIGIDLNSQAHYDFRLGKVYFMKPSNDSVRCDYETLEGRKKIDALLSRLHYIYLTSFESDHTLLSIYLNPDREVMFTYEQGLLVMTIPDDLYLLYNTPIRLHFIDGSIYHIPNFNYMMDYIILKESGPLINSYDVR